MYGTRDRPMELYAACMACAFSGMPRHGKNVDVVAEQSALDLPRV